MAATAPYYQLRDHGLHNGGAYQDASEENFTTSHSGAPTAPMYSESTQSSNAIDVYQASTAQSQLHDPQLEGNMAELIQAATSAAGQVQAAQEAAAREASNRRATRSAGINSANATAMGGTKGKRKRGSSGEHALRNGEDDLENLSDVSVRNKRQKADGAINPEHDYGSDSPDRVGSGDHPDPAALFAEARAAGVHSAAALFRRPSGNTAKKYTRPPMSKLFMSLQLTPENFLHLQAAAKHYMLDPEHPERQNCVGNRGKGDTDMVKLRLFNCVRDFLNDSIGERFFGENAETPSELEGAEMAAVLGEGQAPTRKHVWPRDGNKIISLVTPLLRRMVTNERQRLYAIDTRRGGTAVKKGREKDIDDPSRNEFPVPDSNGRLESPHGEIQQQSSTPFDPSLQAPSAYTHTIHPAFGSPSPYASSGTPTTTGENTIQILVTKNNAKLLPRLDLPSRTSTAYHDIPYQDLQHIIGVQLNQLPQVILDLHATSKGQPERQSLPQPMSPTIPQSTDETVVDPTPGENSPESGPVEEDQEPSTESAQQDNRAPAEKSQPLPPLQVDIRALTGAGLMAIRCEDDWEAVKAEVGRAAWMEGILKIVVEVLS